MMQSRRFWLRGIAIIALLGLSLWYVVSAPPVRSQEKPKPAKPADAEATPFHQFHIDDLGLDCTDCHAGAEDAPSEPQLRLATRPSHETCSDCHDEVNESKYIPLCNTCHIGTSKQLNAFPTGQTTLSKFSHAKHVDPNRRHNAQDIRQDCVFCHQRDTTQRLPQGPKHPECGSCHHGDTAFKPVLDPEGKSEACLGCHSLPQIDSPITARLQGGGTLTSATRKTPTALAHATDSWTTAKGAPYRDIVPFPHNRHIQRRDGVAIDCVTCHSAILQRTGFEPPTTVPAMGECAACHNNASWVRQAFLTKQCRTCHQVVRADIRPQLIDPVSKRLAHTESFRRFHKQQAKSPDRTCQYCHQDAVNSPVDTCAGCHSAMAPRSHQALRFSETGHGRHAAMDRKTCAGCHTASFCISCHQVPPRSHTPLPTFRASAHRHIARLNSRSCFVCHQFESTCAPCHNQTLR